MSRPAMLAAGRNRITLGQDLRLLEVSQGQLWLEGTLRLRPGQAIELIGRWPGVEQGGRASVLTWRVVRLTETGPTYRGCCRIER